MYVKCKCHSATHGIPRLTGYVPDVRVLRGYVPDAKVLQSYVSDVQPLHGYAPVENWFTDAAKWVGNKVETGAKKTYEGGKWLGKKAYEGGDWWIKNVTCRVASMGAQVPDPRAQAAAIAAKLICPKGKIPYVPEPPPGTPPPPSSLANYTTPLLIGGGLLATVILLRKKK